jgi:hypothetical protein
MFKSIYEFLKNILDLYYKFGNDSYSIVGNTCRYPTAVPTTFAICFGLSLLIIILIIYFYKVIIRTFDNMQYKKLSISNVIREFFKACVYLDNILILFFGIIGVGIGYLIGGWIIVILISIIIIAFVLLSIPCIIYGILYKRTIPEKLSTKEKKLNKYKEKLQKINSKIEIITNDIRNLKN